MLIRVICPSARHCSRHLSVSFSPCGFESIIKIRHDLSGRSIPSYLLAITIVSFAVSLPKALYRCIDGGRSRAHRSGSFPILGDLEAPVSRRNNTIASQLHRFPEILNHEIAVLAWDRSMRGSRIIFSPDHFSFLSISGFKIAACSRPSPFHKKCVVRHSCRPLKTRCFALAIRAE